MTNYEKYQQKPDEIFAQEMQKIFDVTQPGGTWLCNEDKQFYCKQIEPTVELVILLSNQHHYLQSTPPNDQELRNQLRPQQKFKKTASFR